MDKNIKGISILESLVCLVIIGIGFVAMLGGFVSIIFAIREVYEPFIL